MKIEDVGEYACNQMLGCGAHVRIIALSHVRCACGSACEMHSGMCVRCACVRTFLGVAMCDSTFAQFLQQNGKNLLLFHFFLTFLNIQGCFKTEKDVPKQNREF